MITVSGDYSFLNQSIHYSFQFPKQGGAVSGGFNGVCQGSITGNYAGGEGENVNGDVSGDCSVAFIKQPVKATYAGKVFLKEGKVDVNYA